MLKDLLEKRFTAKWWSDKPVEKEKLDYILDCTYLAPSKNGKWKFEIFVLGNSEKANEIKQWLYWENTYCLDMKRGKEGETSLCLTPRAYDAHYASMSTTNAYAYTLMSTHNNRTHALTSVTNPRDSNCFMHTLSALTAWRSVRRPYAPLPTLLSETALL